jgi:hypothetical protein
MYLKKNASGDTPDRRSPSAPPVAGEASKATTRPPVCICGDGGTGKTSAALAMFSWMVKEGKRRRGQKHRDDEGEKDLYPLFVPLPAIGKRLLEEKDSLETYVHKAFGLPKDELQTIGDKSPSLPPPLFL